MKQRRLKWQKLDWSEYCSDPRLLLCSWAAQGVWPRVSAICWYADPRGRFVIDGALPTMAELSALWSKPVETIPPLLAELQSRGLLVADRDGFFIKAMVEDELVRQVGQPGETERAVVDRAMETALEVLSADDRRKASGRKRSAKYRSAQRGRRVLEQMRGFVAMEAAEVRAERHAPSVTSVTQASPKASPNPVTVTSPVGSVTSPIPCENQGLRLISTESESESDSEVSNGGIIRRQAS